MKRRRGFADAGIWLFLAVVCLLVLLPIFWIVSTSLKPTAEILVTPTTLFPAHPTLEHYGVALCGDFRRFLRNSLAAAGGVTAIGILLAVPAAWGFAKFPFPGSGALLAFTVVTRVFPPIALALPFFLQFRALGLTDTPLGLVIGYLPIVLPLLKPVLAIILVVRLADALRIFDVVYVLTGGGPANSTDVLSTYIYRQMFTIFDFPGGAAAAVLLVLVTALFSLLAVTLLRSRW